MRLLWVCAVGLCSCSKDGNGELSGRLLLGTWVDVDHTADTLIITRDEKGILLFDNSMAFRTHPDSGIVKDGYRWYLHLYEEGLKTVSFSSGISYGGEGNFYPFHWITEGQQFEVESGSWRPWISCVGCRLRFQKIR